MNFQNKNNVGNINFIQMNNYMLTNGQNNLRFPMNNFGGFNGLNNINNINGGQFYAGFGNVNNLNNNMNNKPNINIPVNNDINSNIMQRLNIPTYYVLGFAKEEHAWNIVKLNGGYYNVDLTWDDTGGVYKHFNLTDRDIAVTHERRGISKNLPKCNYRMG